METGEKQYVLLVSSGDWADEFDLEGFAIFEKSKWENVKEGIPEGNFDAYFGSNEFVSFESKEGYLSHIEEKPISVEEIQALARMLNLHEFKPEQSYYDSYIYGLFVINSENY